MMEKRISLLMLMILVVLLTTSCKTIEGSVSPAPGITNIPNIVKGLTNLGKSLGEKPKVDKEEKK